MQKGNRQSVTYMRDGKEEKMFIEANPRFKTVNVYDGRMQRVNNQAQRESKGQQQTVTKQHNDEKLEVAEGDEGIPGKTTRSKRNRRQGMS